MAGHTIQMHTSKPPDFAKVFEALEQTARFEDMEEVARTEKVLGDVSVYLVVYEKYYMRTDSYASLSVLFTKDELRCSADIIASGGGGGILNFSYGANRDLANACADALEKLGFRREGGGAEEKREGFFSRLLK